MYASFNKKCRVELDKSIQQYSQAYIYIYKYARRSGNYVSRTIEFLCFILVHNYAKSYCTNFFNYPQSNAKIQIIHFNKYSISDDK